MGLQIRRELRPMSKGDCRVGVNVMLNLLSLATGNLVGHQQRRPVGANASTEI